MNQATRLPFGVSQFTTWPQSFEADMALYQEEQITFLELCEGKLDPTKPQAQIEQLLASSLEVTSIQPRVHSLFPDAPRPEPAEPSDRMQCFKATIKRLAPHFPGLPLVTITGAAPRGDYRAAWKRARSEYKELAEFAADYGMKIALEPLNPILMNVDTFLCSLRDARRMEIGRAHV